MSSPRSSNNLSQSAPDSLTSQRWWILASVACGTFMATLDSSIVNIALPTLIKVLSTDLIKIKWVVVAYLLVITCLLLPFGRLSDLYGRRRFYLAGYSVLTLGSLLCGLAPSLSMLVLCRMLQGVGGAMLMSNGPAIITSAFSSGERGKALGTLAMVVSAGLISGPSVGGILISKFGWESIFWVNIPIGILGVYLVFKFLPRDKKFVIHQDFDWLGAFLQMLMLLSFMIWMEPPRISVGGGEAFPISRWIAAVMTLLFALAFLKVESNTPAPLLDLELLKIRNFWTANLASFLSFVSFASLVVLMPFYLEEVMKFTTREAGMLMTTIPLTIFVIAPISGRLSDKMGSRLLSFAGSATSAVGMFAMAGIFGEGISQNASKEMIMLGMGSIGLATGLFQSPNNSAIMSSVPTEKLGVASALLATVRNLGMVTGNMLATILFGWQFRQTTDFMGSIHFSLYVAGVISLAAMFASLGKTKSLK